MKIFERIKEPKPEFMLVLLCIVMAISLVANRVPSMNRIVGDLLLIYFLLQMNVSKTKPIFPFEIFLSVRPWAIVFGSIVLTLDLAKIAVWPFLKPVLLAVLATSQVQT